MNFLYYILFTAIFGCNTDPIKTENNNQNFEVISNPILKDGQDPWIFQEGDTFHYCYSKGNSIYLKSVKKLGELENSKEIKLWTAPINTSYSKEIWAPELHKIEDKWYVYFAADDGENANHRMHVLSSENESINSTFKYSGQISDASNKWAIDGTTFKHRGKRYFVWSGWEGNINEKQNLYIAEMSSPTKITSERTLISTPEFDWEKRGSGGGLPTINEGPEILIKNDKLFIVYSASGSWSDFYCLGQLELVGENLLDKSSWEKRNTTVFESSATVFSPGHQSFVKIKDQDYIIYHTAKFKGAKWNRQVRTQPFYWQNDKPLFGKPIDDGVSLKIEY